MKPSNSPLKPRLLSTVKKLTAILLLSACALTQQASEIVYVLARDASGGINFDGTYYDLGVYGLDTTLLNLGNTSALGSAPGRPWSTGARYYAASTDLADTNLGVVIFPYLATLGGVYQIDHNFSSTAGNVSTNVVMSVYCTNATLSVSSTPVFQRSYGSPANKWSTIGYITNNTEGARASLRFNYLSGRVNASAQLRLLVDCWRFTLVEPCLAVPVVEVVGPLSSDVNEVVVTDVDETATAITVYQNSGAGMVQIGQKTSDIVAGDNTVTVSGLVKAAQVGATQTIGGREGCVPASGTIVGGGANPNVRIVLNIRENTALTGPVGAAGSGSIIHFLGASESSSGAPVQGRIVEPSTNWQTISFTNGVDPLYTWIGTDTTPGTWDGVFGALDGIGFACEGDNGPFDIYIDDLESGTTVFQDFEAAEADALDFGFRAPSYSGTTSGNLLSAPDLAQVTTATAYSGTKSLRVRWQFLDNATSRYLRFVTAGATPVGNPQVESIQPVSFKILLLPVGVTPVSPNPGPLSIALDGDNVILDWAGSYQLQSAIDVTGPFSNVSGVTTGPYTNAVSPGIMFFRLSNQIE